VSLPVGSGKTVIFSNLIRELPSRNKNGVVADKTLILAHREELLLQACRQIEKWCPGSRISLDQGSNSSDPINSDIIVASVPTLGRANSLERRLKYDPSKFKCIVIDEAHHAAAKSYRTILDHFGILNPDNEILLWGCSATFSRNDDLALGDVFEKIVFHVDMQRMMQEGWLCPTQVFQLETDVDLSGVRMSESAWGERDFDFGELNLAINTPERNKLVVDTWYKFAFGEKARRSTIVFALSVDHVNALKEAFTQIGVRAEAITGSTAEAVRMEILEEFGKGNIPVLLNCSVLTEGTDLPTTDCILLTRPTCNPNLYIQMVGRGLRKHIQKDYCLVLDVVDKCRSKRRSLVTFPTLEAFSFPKKQSQEQAEKKENEKREPKELREIDQIRIKLRQITQACVIPDLELHRLAWIRLDSCNYLINGRNREFLLKINNLADSQAEISEKGSTVFSGPMHNCLEEFGRYLKNEKLIGEFLSNAYWRRKYPMTMAQNRSLRGIAEKLGATFDEFQLAKRWNVGKTSNILSRYYAQKKHKIGPPLKSWPDLLSDLNYEAFYSSPPRSSSRKNPISDPH
jgi:ATP-dependent helicase IRC3